MILDDEELNINPSTDQYGMDNLAKSLGLDIEALAVRLAMIEDKPPTQCQAVQAVLGDGSLSLT